MDVLLREVRQRTDGATEYHDTEFAGEALSIGSGVGQGIQLLGLAVAAAHARISKSPAGIAIACSRGRTVMLNGRETHGAAVSVGDVITLAGHRLKLIEPPSGFDLALQIEVDHNIDASEYEGAFRTDLRQTWLRKRPAAWALVLMTLVVFMVAPLVVVTLRNHGKAVPAAIPGDGLWSSGPLSMAHQQATGSSCGACHQALFERVRDTACLDCHKSVADHVAQSHVALANFGDKPRCATCHREHQEPVSRLIVAENSGCTGCHARNPDAFASLKLALVSGFSAASHPEFKVQLLRPVESDPADAMAVGWKQEATSLAGAAENSRLVFSHQQHLDAERVIRNSDSQPLDCVDCHVPDAAGEGFRPVTMKDSCVSCHELTFDPAEPTRQLPHGRSREAVFALQEYFARMFVDPDARPQAGELWRIPGKTDEPVRCAGPAVTCARQATSKEVENQFTVRGCVTCHQVIDTRSADIVDRFQVVPVRLTSDYYPGAHFRHRSHLIQGGLTGSAACQSCHDARGSKRAEDLLIPGISKCLGCHGDKSGNAVAAVPGTASRPVDPKASVQLGCAGCHGYHPG
jgi:predicted CXXCH cytochrome family protein